MISMCYRAGVRWLLTVVVCLCAPSAQAAKVATWRHARSADFEDATADGVVVGSTGELSLGRQLERVADLDCGSVWDLARDADGRVLAATAVPGRLMRIAADGQVETLFEDAAAAAFSVLPLPDGSVLVGTGPEGRVMRVEGAEPAALLAKLDCMYVWDLVADAAGNVYAATGPDGKIFRIDGEGQADVYYETGQPHVLALAQTPDGDLLASTDGQGLVLRIGSDGRGRVLYDAAEDEVGALWIAPDGAVYAATAAAGDKKETSSRSTSGSRSTRASMAAAGKTQAASNSVYRIDRGGAIETVLQTKALFYALGAVGSSPAGAVVAGTGPDGIVYAVDPLDRDGRQLARPDAEQILATLPDEGGALLLSTGNPGHVYRLAGGYRDAGTLVSKPLDAKLAARFGAVVWRADVPAGTQVSLAVRSGNTEEPDDTWSAWSVEQTDAAAARAECPAGRFLQYRVSLRTSHGDATPVVRSVSVRYATANQAPQLTRVTVPHVDDGDGSKSTSKLKLAWEASDPNDDELRYTLSFRKPGWNSWVELDDDLDEKEFEWDITSVPEGVYLVRVEASDRRSNPPDDARVAVRLSEPFVVDRAGPQVAASLMAMGDDRTATFEAAARDALSPVVKASYSIDSGTWINVFPDDGLFDALDEQLRFDVQSLAAGTHVLVVQATDAAGYTGSTDVVFEVGQPKQVAETPAAPRPE